MDEPLVDLSNDESFRHGFPHDFFSRLRDEDPVYWHEPTAVTPDGEGFWVVSRYEDVAKVQRSPKTYSSATGGERTGGGTALKDEASVGVLLNHTDDPRHKRMRSLVNKGFTPRSVGRLEDELRRRTRKMLDAVSGLESFDFVSQAARELPLQAICIVLGVPQEDRSRLCEWIDRGLEAESQSIISAEYAQKIRDYAAAIIDEKRKNPQDDILSVIVHARFEEDGSTLSEPELLAFFQLLFPAGAETTRSALAGGVKAFIDCPDELARLKASPEKYMRSAIEEIVRWTTPSVYKRRTATRNVKLCGRTIRVGDKVTFWEMSANRDARAFAEPFRFDVGRWPNKHLGFGAGVHFCLGASLARLEMRVMLEELLTRYQRFELAGEPSWMPNNRLFGLRYLPIRALG